MDPRERADATLARARARGAFVVTPESAISPMDAANTLQIPRAVVSGLDRSADPEATMVVPAAAMRQPERDRGGEVPAIAQEAFTQVVHAPGGRRPTPAPRERRTGGEPDRRRPTPRPAPPSDPEPQQLNSLIPTEKQPPTTRSTLSQRLDG